jgi:predicted permease
VTAVKPAEWLHSIRLRFKALKDRRRLDGDLAEELAFHRAMKAEKYRAGGETEEDARHHAERAFGNATRTKETLRDAWTFAAAESAWRDIRHAARALKRSPGFTTIAVLTLALGIGANTSVFTVLNALFLRSLPVRDPHELRILNWRGGENVPVRGMSGYSRGDKSGVRTSGSFSFETYQQFRADAAGFQSIAGFANLTTNAAARGEAWVTPAQLVSGNYFDTLGARAALGRTFTAADDSLSAAPAAVISWRLWQRLYGGDPAALGSQITIERRPYTLIGVMPAKFGGLALGRFVDLYLPLARAEEQVKHYTFTKPDFWWVQMVGRLAPAGGEAQAKASLDVVMSRVVAGNSSRDKKKVETPTVLLIDGHAGLAFLDSTMSRFLLSLLAMVGMVLLIACANVANLLIARGTARARELAIRRSLGAGRLRVIVHLLTESLLIAGAGGSLGLLVSRLGTAALSALLAHGDSAVDLRPDATVLAFTAWLSLLTALLAGLAPAIRASRSSPSECLKQGTAGSGAPRQRLAAALILVQVALAMVLAVGAGLFGRTLVNLQRVELGFKPDKLLLFYVDPSRNGYKDQALFEAHRSIQRKVAAIPGVRAVSYSENALVSGSMSNSTIVVPGYQAKAGEEASAYVHMTGDHFLTVMGTPILLGRDLLESDNETAPRAAVINATMARKYFSNGNPVGREFTFEGKPQSPMRVVGVSADVKYDRVSGEVPATVYIPFSQQVWRVGAANFAVRTSGDPLSIMPAVRRVVASVDRTLPVAEVRTQQQQIDQTLARERTFAFLASFFSVVAVALACLGIYGMLAYTVARRTREFGVRLALGATAGQVKWLAVRGSLALAGAGTAMGIPAAVGASKVIQAGLYGVEPADPKVIVGAAAAMIASAGVAAWMAGRRASEADPVAALRCE